MKRFYYDTVNFDSKAVQLAIDFAGVSHVIAGSDYPHKIGSLRKMLDGIAGLSISDQARADILGNNTARLLGS